MVLIFVLLCASVTAKNPAPVIQTDSGLGLRIIAPKQENYKLGDNISLHFHVYNSSNYQVRTAQCYFHLYNRLDKHLLKKTLSLDDIDYEVLLNQSVLSYTGRYPFLAWCNGTKGAGYYSSSFFVTPSGKEDDEGFSVLLFSFLPLIFAGFMIFGAYIFIEGHPVLVSFLYLGGFAFSLIGIQVAYELLYHFYDFQVFEGSLSWLVWVQGLTCFTLLSYFLIHLFKTGMELLQAKKRERQNY